MTTASRRISRFIACSFIAASEGLSIELFPRQDGEVDALERPGVDRGHRVPFGVRGELERLAAPTNQRSEPLREQMEQSLVGIFDLLCGMRRARQPGGGA